MDFDNLHQVLRNLYQEMMPLCGDMIGVAKGIAGLGALFYVAYRVWKALANAEPIDVFPLLRPFAIGLCVMFFPTVVLGTINAVMSPVVQGTHAILEGQTLDLQAYQQQKDDLEAEARRREGKAWLVDDEVYEQRLADMGITDLGEIISMWAERTWYDIKAGFRQLVRDFFELLFNAAGLTIDTLRTFFLVVLSILGPLSFALSIYDGFHSTLASWISRYISVYLWLPIADLFSAVLAKIQTLMLQADVLALQDPNYIPDSGSGVYIIFLIIGIIGYFTIPTVAEWVIQSGGAGGAMGGINKAGAFATGVAGGIAGNMIGRTFGRRGGGGSSSCLCALVSVFSVVASFRFAEKQREKIYVLDGGKSLMLALSQDLSQNRPVEAREHIRRFHELFFTLSPDRAAIESNINRALFLVDKSAFAYYQDMQEKGYYNRVVSGNISQRIEVDSVVCDFNAYPYRAMTYARQMIVRESNITERSLVTRCELINSGRSDNNPQGFIMEKFEILENRDLRTLKR